MMTREEKTHEQRVRRMADRQWLALSRVRVRDPMALDYGRYCLFDRDGFAVPVYGEYRAPLDAVEKWLREGGGRDYARARAARRKENPVMVSAERGKT